MIDKEYKKWLESKGQSVQIEKVSSLLKENIQIGAVTLFILLGYVGYVGYCYGKDAGFDIGWEARDRVIQIEKTTQNEYIMEYPIVTDSIGWSMD